MLVGLYDNFAERIRARCPSVLQVATGTKPEDAVEMLALGPDVTALVHPISTVAVPTREAALIVSQARIWRIGVTMALVYPGGMAQFEAASVEIDACLSGWMYPGASKPVEFAAQRTLQFHLGQDGGRQLELLEYVVAANVVVQAQP